MAAGALMFLRGDIKSAKQTVERTYSTEQVLDSGLLPGGLRTQPGAPPSEQPYFTPGFPLFLPLMHGVRIKSLNGPPTTIPAVTQTDPIVSDTRELSWYTSPENTGMVTVETDRAQALIGFIKANHKTLKNLGADITNQFAAIVLTSMDGKPLARSDKMLLNAGSRVANTDQKWNDARTGLGRGGQGQSPTLIEPVTGTVTLRNIEGAAGVSAAALDGAGKPIGAPIEAKKTAGGWDLPIGNPVTTWYVVSVRRH
jgi:hypothetical protein